MFSAVMATPVGILGLTCEADKLVRIDFLNNRVIPMPHASLSAKIKKIVKKIEAFFSSPQSLVDVPHVLQGTPFQRKVWEAMREIPPGESVTYGQLAWELRTAPRAIGMACRTNRIPLIIPCHRVVASNNDGGFCGQTTGDKVEIKRWLLAHEKGKC